MPPSGHTGQRYEENLAVLSAHHPHLSAAMARPARIRLELQPSPAGIPNLRAWDTDNRSFFVYPEADPLGDLPGVLSTLGAVTGKIIVIMGFALGHYVLPLFEKYGDNNLIVIYEAYPEALKLAMAHADFRPLFSHPNVRLIVGDLISLQDIPESITDQAFADSPPKLVELYRWIRLSHPWYREAQKAMERYYISIRNTTRTLQDKGRLFFENKFSNLVVLKDALPLSVLRGCFHQRPGVVVAAGPSLSANINSLKTAGEHRPVVIAVDSAVAPLLKAGIVPDFIVVADVLDFAYEKLASIQDEIKDCRLIFLPETNPATLKYIHFKERFYAYLGEACQRGLDAILGKKTCCLTVGESVVHLALLGAQEMGCDPIIFMGVDFCFSDGQDHAQGTLLHWGGGHGSNNGPMVEDIHGNMAPTEPYFLTMLETCERMIAGVPDRHYIDATEGGVRINGTTLMTAAEALATYCVAAWTHPSLPPSEGRSSEAVLANLESFKKILEVRRGWLDQYLGLSKKIDNGAAGKTGHSKALNKIEQVLVWMKTAGELAVQFDGDEFSGFLMELLSQSSDRIMAYEKARLSALAVGDNDAIVNTHYEKQRFVQQLRMEALTTALALLEQQIKVFRKLCEFERVIDEKEENGAECLALAAFLFEQNHLSAAALILESLPVDDPWVRFYTGGILLMRGKVAEALSLLAPVRATEPLLEKQIDALFRDVETRWLEERTMESYRNITRPRLIQLGPSTKVIETLWPDDLDCAEKKIAGPDISVPHVNAILQMLSQWETVKDTLPGWHALKAKCLRILEGTGAAIAYLDRLANEKEKLAGPEMSLLSRLLIEEGRFAEGIRLLQEAISVYPEAAVLWEEIGDMLNESGDHAGGLIAYENCLKVLPERQSLFLKIGDCYLAAGKTAAARMAYEALLAKAPDDQAAKERLRGMENDNGIKNREAGDAPFPC